MPWTSSASTARPPRPTVAPLVEKGGREAGHRTKPGWANHREFLTDRGTTPVIKQNPTRKRVYPFDKDAYKGRNVIERAFSHLKDWRRVATRYDKLARNFRSTVILATILLWWIN